MDHVRELIRSRIDSIQDPVQKVLLRDVLVDVFEELAQYSEDRFAELEEKIDRELEDPSQKYAIYTGICKKEELDDTSRFLFEVKTGEERRKGYLGTLFLACDYPAVRCCLGKTYRAKVETDAGEVETEAALYYSEAYRKKIEWLYRQFSANQRPWHTVNCPFLYKLLDIVDTKGRVPRDAQIQKVELSMGALSRFVTDEAVLVWNVREEIHPASVEVKAAGKEAVYEHRIALPEPEAGYLAAPGKDGFTVVFYEDTLLVRTVKEEQKRLKLFKVAPPDTEKDHTALWYPLQTNRRKMRHADRQAERRPCFVFTRGEVERVLSSYEAFDEFELVDIRPDMAGEGERLECNPFFKTHSFLKEKPKIALILHPKDGADIFRYEKMFFFVSELQLRTEEYEWVGILR